LLARAERQPLSDAISVLLEMDIVSDLVEELANIDDRRRCGFDRWRRGVHKPLHVAGKEEQLRVWFLI